jgi:site-specific DNA-cytosine methylase
VLRALSLFSGIGGLDLAAEMAGIKVVGLCEIEPFPVEVLKKRFPGVPIFEDVRKLTAEVIRDKTRMGTSQSIDIIFGGFPCQDLSVAGKQKGLEGERSGLWFEMLRVVHELRPSYVLAENVRGAVNLALDTVYTNLVDEGYKVYPYVIPASAVGAPHQRERLFVVGVREDVHRRYTEAMANPGCELRQGSEFSRADGVETGNRDADKFERPSGTLWPSPVASDGSCGGIISPDDIYIQKESGLFRKINRNGTDGSVGLARMVKLWPTPRAQEPGRTTEGYGRGLQELVEGKEQRKLWPTPTQRDYKGTSAEEGLIRKDGKSRMDQLPNAVKFWPTPTGTERSGVNPITGRGAGLSKVNGGQLNPDWVEQLMNFPEGWTDLDVDEPKPWAGWPALLGQEQYPYEHPRTTTGCKDRAKRLKALGNAVVPAQAYPFFRAIMEIERRITNDRL